MARFTARVTERISPRTKLWIYAWQCQSDTETFAVAAESMAATRTDKTEKMCLLSAMSGRNAVIFIANWYASYHQRQDDLKQGSASAKGIVAQEALTRKGDAMIV